MNQAASDNLNNNTKTSPLKRFLIFRDGKSVVLREESYYAGLCLHSNRPAEKVDTVIFPYSGRKNQSNARNLITLLTIPLPLPISLLISGALEAFNPTPGDGMNAEAWFTKQPYHAKYLSKPHHVLFKFLGTVWLIFSMIYCGIEAFIGIEPMAYAMVNCALLFILVLILVYLCEKIWNPSHGMTWHRSEQGWVWIAGVHKKYRDSLPLWPDHSYAHDLLIHYRGLIRSARLSEQQRYYDDLQQRCQLLHIDLPDFDTLVYDLPESSTIAEVDPKPHELLDTEFQGTIHFTALGTPDEDGFKHEDLWRSGKLLVVGSHPRFTEYCPYDFSAQNTGFQFYRFRWFDQRKTRWVLCIPLLSFLMQLIPGDALHLQIPMSYGFQAALEQTRQQTRTCLIAMIIVVFLAALFVGGLLHLTDGFDWTAFTMCTLVGSGIFIIPLTIYYHVSLLRSQLLLIHHERDGYYFISGASELFLKHLPEYSDTRKAD